MSLAFLLTHTVYYIHRCVRKIRITYLHTIHNVQQNIISNDTTVTMEKV